MDKDLIYFKKIVESNGHKFTKQKEYVLKILIQSNIHLSAEEIYRKIIKERSFGLATVYRALKVFKELNIIKEISVDGTNYYEMKIFSGKPLHIHFKCKECNSIIDIDSKYLNMDYLRLNSKIEEDNNLVVFDSDIMLIGLCTKCMEEKNGETNKV